MTKSKHSQKSTLKKTEDGFLLSVYSGELTDDCIAKETINIKSAFPDLDPGFYDVLYDQLNKLNFSNERFRDAVDHVIRTCEYPRPTIAKFLSYDQHVKLYSYDQYINLEAKTHYKSVRIAGAVKPMWAHVNDIEKYKLEAWNNESS